MQTPSKYSASVKVIDIIKMPSYYILPIYLSFATLITPLILFTITYCNGHSHFMLPYISDMAVLPPESSWFSFFLNIGSFIVTIFVYLRYNIQQSHDPLSLISNLNFKSMISGGFFAFGWLLVANFRFTESLIIHTIGAAVVFTSGTIDAAYQSIIAHKLNHLKFTLIRCLISIGILLGFTFSIVFTVLAAQKAGKEKFADFRFRLKWPNNEPGFQYYVISVLGEWFAVSMFVIYFLTFTSQFKKSEIKNH